MKKSYTASQVATMRQNFRFQLAASYIKENLPELWTMLNEEVYKKYPRTKKIANPETASVIEKLSKASERKTQ